MWPAPAITLSSADSSAASASSRASVRGTTSSLAPATIKKRAGRHPGYKLGRPQLPHLASPGCGVRRVAPGMDQATRSGLGHKAPRVTASVRELGRRRQRGHTGYRRVLSGSTYGQGAAGRETDQPDFFDAGDFPQRPHPGDQIGPPAAEREIATRRPDAPEVEGEHGRTGLGGQARSQLREAVAGRPGPLARLGEPMGKDYAVAARARSGREVGPGQVAR